MRTTWLASLAAVLIACGPTSSPGEDGDGDGDGGGDGSNPSGVDAGNNPPTTPPNEFADAAPPEACEKMDILFVVDNSGSMGQEQANLALNFPMFVDVLNSFVAQNGNPIDYRVGVTSTGVSKTWIIEPIPGFPIPSSQDGEDGELLQRCDMTRRWVEKGDPTPAATFGCAAELGTGGANTEMPLEAIRLAFGDRISDGTNAGFLREDALLAIVILTDENDCSRQDNNFMLGLAEDVCANVAPVPQYKDFLDTVAGGAGRWAVAVIAGPGPGACSSEFGDADESTRLIQFAGMAGANGIVSSICEGDLTGALSDALMTFDTACQTLPPID